MMKTEILDEIESQERVGQNALEVIEYPSVLKRQQAALVDFLFVVLLIFIGNMSFGDWFHDNRNYQLIYYVSLLVVYEPLSMALGCTAGHYLTRIRVRKQSNRTNNISVLQSFIRFIFRITLGWFGWLSIHRNDDMRALYDIFSGSIVLSLDQVDNRKMKK